MIDSHAHLNFAKFNQDYAEVIQRSFDNGIKAIINVGSNLATSQRAIEIAKKFDNCYAAVGLHPIYVYPVKSCEAGAAKPLFNKMKDEEFDLEKYYSLIRANERVIKAIGETGLDYTVFVRQQSERLQKRVSVDLSAESADWLAKKTEVKDEGESQQFIIQKQKEIFSKHLELAHKFNLPVILHCREGKINSKDAYVEMLKMLQVTNYKLQGVLHCFSADWRIAKQFLDLGFYVGFTGIITFPNAGQDLLEVVAKTPLDKILIETDCPFLAPQPVRGQRCEPWHVKYTAEKIAKVKKKRFEEIIRATTENANRLFNL